MDCGLRKTSFQYTSRCNTKRKKKSPETQFLTDLGHILLLSIQIMIVLQDKKSNVTDGVPLPRQRRSLMKGNSNVGVAANTDPQSIHECHPLHIGRQYHWQWNNKSSSRATDSTAQWIQPDFACKNDNECSINTLFSTVRDYARPQWRARLQFTLRSFSNAFIVQA